MIAKALRIIAAQMEDSENYRTDEYGVEALCISNAADYIDKLEHKQEVGTYAFVTTPLGTLPISSTSMIDLSNEITDLKKYIKELEHELRKCERGYFD